MFKQRNAKLNDFVGRKIEMHSIISSLMDQRMVTIKGVAGIGKTTIAKNISNYLDERNFFRDGIVYICLRKVDSSSMFMTKLFLAISSHF